MVTTNANFSRQVKTFTDRYDRRLLYIVRRSTQKLLDQAQRPVAKGGNMPVDTGFLRSSLTSQIAGGTAIVGAASYGALLGQVKLGDLLEFSWTAQYAIYVHYGTSSQQGRFWATLAAQQWRRIVDEATQEARSKI